MKTVCVVVGLVLGGVGWAVADTAAYREMLSHPVATAADAYRAVAGLALPADKNLELSKSGLFSLYRDALVDAGIVPARWEYAADAPATKRMLAYLVCRVAHIQGGLTIRLFGLSPRYALRECVYLKIILPRSDYRPVSGREVLAIVKRAEDYMQRREIVMPLGEEQP